MSSNRGEKQGVHFLLESRKERGMDKKKKKLPKRFVVRGYPAPVGRARRHDTFRIKGGGLSKFPSRRTRKGEGKDYGS